VPKLAQRYRPGPLMASGAALMAVGLAALSMVGTGTPPAVAAVVIAIFQIGVAPLVTLGNNLVIGSAPPHASGQASGTSQTLNELGGALGIAVLGSIGAVIYRGQMADTMPGDDSPAADAARDTLGGAVAASDSLPDRLLEAASEAFTQGLQVAALTSAIAAAALAVVALIVLPRVNPA
jgi:MFS transporter, DHA2 family, multidrug resistance protein